MNAQRKSPSQSRNSKARGKKAGLLEALPQRAAALVQEGEARTLQLVEAGRHQVEEAAAQVTAGYQQLTTTVVKRTRKAQKNVERQGNAALDVVLKNVDVVLDRVGLVRKSVHQQQLARLKARLQKNPGRRKSTTPRAAPVQLQAV